MKKIKMTIAAAMFCAAAFAGYTAYEQTTMTEAERMIIANIEALADDESYSKVVCKGSGSIQCPHGGTANYVKTVR